MTVVLGAHAAELAPLLRHTPAAVVVNRDWAEGMGSSVRAAVERLPGASDGVLVLLADQIAVTAGDLQRLVGAWRRNPDSIAAASYGGVLGVPAIFPRWCYPALAELRGDQGARAVLRRHAGSVQRILMPNAGIDIDRPEDLLELEVRRRGGGPAADGAGVTDPAEPPQPPGDLTA